MRAYNPFESLHSSLAHAIHVALPDITYTRKDWTESKKQGADVYVSETQRPTLHDVTVEMFDQTWSDTSCGFGGMAGQAFTSAYTVVVLCDATLHYAVYHNQRFAYLIDARNQSESGRLKFLKDLSERNLAGKMDWSKYK
jgi:hypothetical protein